jgi:tripartite-type tricarboxylate transporter receptor subunit TctC
MRTVQTTLLATVAIACTAFAAAPVIAQTDQGYPNKPIRIIVPFTPGSAADLLARRLAPRMNEAWAQPVLVENRTGAGGTVGTAVVAKAIPDGYTLLVHSAAFATSAALYSKLPYDPLKDFAPVTQISRAPLVLVVAPSIGVKSVKDLITLAAQKPGQITFGSSGIGSSTHFGGESFRIAAGISVVHVPYKGPPEVLADTIAGRVHYYLAPLVPALPFIRDGRLLALAVTTTGRNPVLPDVPTVGQAALPGHEYQDWWGMFAPVGTPSATIERIQKETARILQFSDIKSQMLAQGEEPVGSTPEEFTRFVRGKIEDASRAVQAAGIRVQ